MENSSQQGDNHVLYTKIEATLHSTNKGMLICHIPT